MPESQATIPDVAVPDAATIAIKSILMGILSDSTLSGALASFIGQILSPIIRQEVRDAFNLLKDTGEIGKPNDTLQLDFNS